MSHCGASYTAGVRGDTTYFYCWMDDERGSIQLNRERGIWRLDIVPHRRIDPIKAILVAQEIVNPLDRVALLLRRTQIIGQNQINEATMPIQVRAPWRTSPSITRRRRMRHHLRDRPAINAKSPSRFALARTLAQNRQPNPFI